MKIYFIIAMSLFLISCNETPRDKIIDYAKEKYGNDFKEGVIDLSNVFSFKWDKLYIFDPLLYPEDITKAIGFKYFGDIIPEDNYLILFTKDSMIVKQYPYFRQRIGFSDDNYTGVYMVDYRNAKYKVKLLGKDNYWLYKMSSKNGAKLDFSASYYNTANGNTYDLNNNTVAMKQKDF